MKRHLLIIFCFIQLPLVCQIKFETLDDTVLLRKFSKYIKINVKVTIEDNYNSDTLIFFNNTSRFLYYNLYKEDYFFQLSYIYKSGRYERYWDAIYRLPPLPRPTFLPRVDSIFITSDTTFLLKLSTDKIHEVFTNSSKKCLSMRLSYYTNDYHDYISDLENNKKYVNHLINSENNVVIKRTYTKSSRFTNWFRRHFIPPNIGIYPFKYKELWKDYNGALR